MLEQNPEWFERTHPAAVPVVYDLAVNRLGYTSLSDALSPLLALRREEGGEDPGAVLALQAELLDRLGVGPVERRAVLDAACAELDAVKRRDEEGGDV